MVGALGPGPFSPGPDPASEPSLLWSALRSPQALSDLHGAVRLSLSRSASSPFVFQGGFLTACTLLSQTNLSHS